MAARVTGSRCARRCCGPRAWRFWHSSALAFVARSGPTDFDRRIYQLVDPLDVGPEGFDVDALIQFFDPAPWTLLVLATAILWSRWGRGLALLLVMGVTVEFATLGAKLLFALYSPGLLSGYPSGHVTRVAVTGGLVLLWLVVRHHRRLEVAAAAAVVVVGVVLAVGSLRVMNGSHQAIDAAGGMLLAAVWVLGIAALALARRNIPLLPADHQGMAR